MAEKYGSIPYKTTMVLQDPQLGESASSAGSANMQPAANTGLTVSFLNSYYSIPSNIGSALYSVLVESEQLVSRIFDFFCRTMLIGD